MRLNASRPHVMLPALAVATLLCACPSGTTPAGEGETSSSSGNSTATDGGGNANTDGGGSSGSSGVDGGEPGDAGPGECGDGVRNTGEQCDDGNTIDDDLCRNNCTPTCGDGVVAANERCDTAVAAGMTGACPSTCTPTETCTTGTLEGTGCQAECVFAPVSTCADDDGCCGFGCNNADDNDCTATCGNGVLEDGETCDPQGTCPSTCDDNNACTTDTTTGALATCDVACSNAAITTCVDGDGCCPSACNATTDNDCAATCNNGVVEGNEACDGNCPATCDDMNPCTADSSTGSADACSLRCVNTPVEMTVAGDQCCPAGANANTDPDCMPACNNGVVEAGERCDGNCPTACTSMDACNPNVLVGSAMTCDARCEPAAVMTCTGNDGCCPQGCTNMDDNDCSASCGNGMLDPGETCDPQGTCPTACTAPNACTTSALTGNAANCNARCVDTPITACSLTMDGCCAPGCNANTDADCAPSCGNGVVEAGETCDGNCPSSCTDNMACTRDVLTGTADTCDAACTFPAITTCSTTADGCCAPGCTQATDADCSGSISPASTVTLTSSCLVAGSGARAAVVVTLTDTAGMAVNGADVQVSTTAGTLGAVTANGNVYVAVLAAPAAAGMATVRVTANGTLLTAAPMVTFAAPFTDLQGGGGGCDVEGNLRVRVVDPAGAPVGNAYVMVGAAENTAAYAAAYGAAPSLPNSARTNMAGYATFADLGGVLRGAQTITAGVEAHAYMTFASINAADVVMVVRPLVSPDMTGTYAGEFTDVTAPANSPIEFGLMLPDTSLERLANLNLASLLGDNECYAGGGALGNVAIPSNLFIPAQCAARIGVCLQSLPLHAYLSPPMRYGARKLVALYGDAPLAALTGGGGIASAIPQITLRRAGVLDRTVSAPGPTTANISAGTTLSTDVTCALSNLPPESDVFCATAVDFDSAASATLNAGDGRLGLTGFKLATLAAGTTSANITGVARVPVNTGAFQGGEYLGIAVASYLDDARPGIVPGTAGGSTAVMVRRNPYGNTGGTVTVNNFLPLRTVTQSGRQVTLGAATTSASPAAHLVIHDFNHVRVENYMACAENDSTRTSETLLWRVYAPGSSAALTLPALPSGWPRADQGGNFAGLVNPSTTVFADRVRWSAVTAHMGLRDAGFNYDRVRLSEYVPTLTHVSTNDAQWQ